MRPLTGRALAIYNDLCARHRKSYELSTWSQAKYHQQAQEQAAQEQAAERKRAMVWALARLKPGLAKRDPAAMTAYVEAVAAHYGGHVIWQRPENFPRGTLAYAEWRERRAVCPIIERPEQFASALHEVGHLAAGECPREYPHFVDPQAAKSHRCLMCEAIAWQRALSMAPDGYIHVVQEGIRRGLGVYRDSTPGAGEAFRLIDRMTGPMALKEHTSLRLRLAR